MLNWILNARHVLVLLAAFALLTPLGALYGHARRGLARRLAIGLGASGPLLLLLWFAFNSIEDALGLDSLAGMGLNALLFVAVGCLWGAWVRS